MVVVGVDAMGCDQSDTTLVESHEQNRYFPTDGGDLDTLEAVPYSGRLLEVPARLSPASPAQPALELCVCYLSLSNRCITGVVELQCREGERRDTGRAVASARDGRRAMTGRERPRIAGRRVRAITYEE